MLQDEMLKIQTKFALIQS